MRNAAIIVLTAALAFTSYRLAHVENQRYALLVGMCKNELQLPDPACLQKVQTRTSWAWHIYYGLFSEI
ncbi:MAG: hypothetical protein HC869_22945 [Rhodospirillales bacterium]|nr:hypothetical protein [Rhodospirillales bacterium]